MRAKYINEAFKDESDPIHDMGIGTDKVIRDWLETIGDFKNYPRLNNWIWICIKHNKPEYADYLLKKHPHTMDVHMDDDNPMNWAIFNNNSEIKSQEPSPMQSPNRFELPSTSLSPFFCCV